MNRFRFSLASLIGLVCATGVVLGTLRYSTRLRAWEIAVLGFFAMSCATLAGIFGSERTKRVWLPFAIFSWGYLLVATTFGANTPPGEYVAAFLSAVASHYPVGLDSRMAIEFVLALGFGLLGSAVFGYYWKRFGSNSTRSGPAACNESASAPRAGRGQTHEVQGEDPAGCADKVAVNPTGK